MPEDTVSITLKKIFAHWLLPLAVTFSLGAFFTGRALQFNLEWLVSGSAVGILLLTMLLERWLPVAAHWNHSQQDSGTDLTSTAVLLGFVDPMLKYLAPLGVVALYALFDLAPWYSRLVGAMPFALQLLLVTLLIELARYWLHRLHHTVGWLWQLHAMHHSSQRLYALNNFRFHPLNYLLLFLGSIFPLMLLGVPAELLLGYLALSSPVLMLQHANLDLKSGLLNYLFSTNELHRWHHSANAAEANANYGHALIIWDLLFGTFKYQPGSNNMPATLGLFAHSQQRYPATASYWRQLRAMFGGQCCRQSAD